MLTPVSALALTPLLTPLRGCSAHSFLPSPWRLSVRRVRRPRHRWPSCLSWRLSRCLSPVVVAVRLALRFVPLVALPILALEVIILAVVPTRALEP